MFASVGVFSRSFAPELWGAGVQSSRSGFLCSQAGTGSGEEGGGQAGAVAGWGGGSQGPESCLADAASSVGRELCLLPHQPVGVFCS